MHRPDSTGLTKWTVKLRRRAIRRGHAVGVQTSPAGYATLMLMMKKKDVHDLNSYIDAYAHYFHDSDRAHLFSSNRA